MLTAERSVVKEGRLPGQDACSELMAPLLSVRDLWHRYDAMAAGSWTLQGFSLELGAGELVGLLGPSGCGKTTLLRLIAGFERPQRGSILLDGREVSGPQRWLPPEARGVGMVFQDYALFPHLDAWQNACYGLPSRRRGAGGERAAGAGGVAAGTDGSGGAGTPLPP